MYAAFSDPKNIRKMVRVIEVFWEEITLQVMLLPWKHRLYKNYPRWWKYVSSPHSKNKRVIFLYYDSKTEELIIKEIIKDLLRDKNYYHKLNGFFKNSYANYKKITDALYKKREEYYRALSNDELINIFKDYLKYAEFVAYAYYVPFNLILACSAIVKEDFKSLSGKNFFDGVFDENKIFEIITTYQIDTIAKKGRQIKKIKKEKILLNKVLSIFKKEKDVLKHIKWLRQALNDRNYESEKVNIYYERGVKLYKEIDRRLGTTPDGHLFLSKGEIIDSLSGKINAKKIYKERKKKGFTIKQKGGKIVVFTGVNKEDYHENTILTNKDSKLIKGTPTYLGKAKGKAKIIFNPGEEDDDFKKGMVLVASMTTPEFITLMKRSAAIITDEGGLLCHAAIISREFEIPCITGTRVATKILKDGDLVEVDAYEGVVKIIKKV